MYDRQYWETTVRRGLSRFLLLGALAHGPKHGYALSTYLRDCCAGCCEPSFATIYPMLQELVGGGYVECTEEQQGRRLRKVCKLTPKGMEAYRTAAQAWARAIPHVERFVNLAQEQGEETLAGKGA